MAGPDYRDRLREKVLALTRQIIEAEGIEAAQARRIAGEADCSVGSLYNVFGDIDGLILALNATTLTALGEALGVALRSAQDASLRVRLETLALGYLRFAMQHRGLWDAVFRYRRKPASQVPASYLEHQAGLLALIEAEIAPLIADKASRATAARALFGSVHGIVALAIDERLGGGVHNDYEEQVRLVVRLVARGLDG